MNHSKEYYLIKKTTKYLFGYRLRLAVAGILNLLEIGMDLVQPFIWGFFIADICQMEFSRASYYIVSLTFIYIAQIVVTYFAEYNLVYINENIERNMRMDIYEKIMCFSLASIEMMGEGDILSRLEGDVMSISTIFTNQLFNVAINLLKVIVICIVVVRVNLLLAVIITLFFPVAYLVMVIIGRKVNTIDQVLRCNVDNYYSLVQNTVKGIREIKVFGLRPLHCDMFFKTIAENARLQINISKLEIIQNNLIAIIDFLAQITIYIVGIRLIIKGELSVELFIAMASYTVLMSSSLLQVACINPQLQEAVVSLKRIQSILDEINDKQETFGKESIDSIKKIEFEDVCFSYGEGNRGINNITFTIDCPGKYIISGENGCGKTTLVSLLLRLYSPNAGDIKFNGKKVEALTEQTIINNVALISRDSHLFGMSVYDNIVLNKKISLDEVKQVCKRVEIDDFIETLESGYYTKVHNYGTEFSTGQRQKMTIARAIIKDSPVMVFDEATASLDCESRELIFKIIDELSKDHIVIVIDHGLTVYEENDKLLLLKGGKQVAWNTYKELSNSKTKNYFGFDDRTIKEQ